MVSSREILREAGAANTAAVAYHFGNKMDLFRAVFTVRTEQLELVRASMLSDLIEKDQTKNLRALAEAMFLPLVNLTDAKGDHQFAAFLFSLEQGGLLQDAMVISKTRKKLSLMIKKCLPRISNERFEAHYSLASFMFTCGLIKLDRLRNKRSGLSPIEEKKYIQDLISMFLGSLSSTQSNHCQPVGCADAPLSDLWSSC